ncbi:DUF4270 family protein [Tenacibaculum sp. L6]|uniref:DUF4270 family protein n=1 Tax=Tenacibaculum sp. L6 TaxID=2992764 RepID=UPI00237AB6F2|nr:DUF4270 family protein [Tenacibaculum sp. L6]MDE0536090.1 DUF4270 family protein [Tenacibaculum sp. L6]
MIRKIGALGISLLCLAAFTSCEKDFSDVGTNVVTNDKFETGEILLDVEITPIDIQKVQADNINANISEYWLGVYNNPNGKKIEASIVSQLGFIENPNNKNTDTTVFNLEKVILKIPYQATSTGTTDNVTTFRLDSILGDPTIATSIQVLQNETYLNSLNPNDPSKKNTFFSDDEYAGNVVLNEDGGIYELRPKATDTEFIFDRIDRSISLTNTTTYKDTIRATNSQDLNVPFLAIPLDLTTMKTLFWDEFQSGKFASKEAFDNYFRGIKIIATGNDGSMVPLNLTSANPVPSIDFLYTRSDVDGTTIKNTAKEVFSFPLSGVRNSVYKMTDATSAAPANNFVIQGTAGSMAEVKILDDTILQELKSQNLLINDASLTFYVNQSINNNKSTTPQQLFLYQNKDNGAGEISPTHISDVYTETGTFGGSLSLAEDNKTPEKYTFRITNYITNLLAGEDNFTAEPLVLKVYNPTDFPTTSSTGGVNTNVKTYNWNPRAVTLLNGNEAANGTKKAIFKISYSKEK